MVSYLKNIDTMNFLSTLRSTLYSYIEHNGKLLYSLLANQSVEVFITHPSAILESNAYITIKTHPNFSEFKNAYNLKHLKVNKRDEKNDSKNVDCSCSRF